MVDEPERIWTDDECHYETRNPYRGHAVEYLRADIAARQVAQKQALFDECAVARDASGFIGSVPQCIEHWSECAENYERKARSLADQLAELRAKMGSVIAQIADERDRLTADMARKDAALRPIAKIADIEDSIGTEDGESIMINVKLCRQARAALASVKGE